MTNGLIGLELECLLIDHNGKIKNNASEIINDPNNNGNIVKECSQSMIEVISSPASLLKDLEEYFTRETKIASEIAKKHGLRLIPSISIGKDADIKSFESARYNSKKAILGTEKRTIEYHITGTHLHIDKLKTPELQSKQYQIMTAMDPLFSLMSSTPFFQGVNTLMDYRVHLYRNVVFKDNPMQGQLLPHVNSIEEATQRQMNTYYDWVNLAKDKGFNGDGFSELNTCWGPIKLTPKTIEYRSCDSNLLSNVFAMAAIQKGIMSFIENENPNIIISDEKNIENLFSYEDNSIIIPSYNSLKSLEKMGIHTGLNREKLTTYLQNILSLSELYLPNDEKKYLEPFKESLDSKSNLSTKITDFAKDKNIYNNPLSDAAANQIRNYIADQMENDINKERYFN